MKLGLHMHTKFNLKKKLKIKEIKEVHKECP